MPYKSAEGKFLVFQLLTSAIVSYWAAMPAVTNLLVFLVIVDYGTGIAAAFVNKELSSSRGGRGLMKKVGYFVAIIVAHELSKPLGLGGDIGAAVALFLVINEGISIFENLSKIGVPLPTSLTETLAKLREK